MNSLIRRWTRFWMRFSGTGRLGRAACGLAGVFHPPFFGRVPLASLRGNGYFSPSSSIHHSDLVLGNNLFVGDRVLIYEDAGGGRIELGAGVHVHRDTAIQTGAGGKVVIGDNTHIQPRCQLSAYKGSISIGQQVEIAPNCSFYPYDHGMAADTPIGRQALLAGDIVIEDGVWLGVGVIVLNGVRIGKGAVIGAGSVVSKNIPDMAVAVGVPAKVVKYRSDAS